MSALYLHVPAQDLFIHFVKFTTQAQPSLVQTENLRLMSARYLRIEEMSDEDVCFDLLEYVKNQATYFFFFE